MVRKNIVWRWVIRPLLGLAAFSVFYWLSLQVTGNVHEVIAGEFYRSGQMSEEGFARYVKKYQIKSVINLRGENNERLWYLKERMAAQALDVDYFNFRMSSKRDLSPAEVRALVTLMRNAPKPVLIHCRAGADRTGLASALYMAAIHHASEFEAELQLSPLYGHLSHRFGAPAMNRTFETMEAWLGYGQT